MNRRKFIESSAIFAGAALGSNIPDAVSGDISVAKIPETEKPDIHGEGVDLDSVIADGDYFITQINNFVFDIPLVVRKGNTLTAKFEAEGIKFFLTSTGDPFAQSGFITIKPSMCNDITIHGYPV